MHKSDWFRLAAYVFVTIVAVLTVLVVTNKGDTRLYNAQINSCERSNRETRAQLNKNTAAFKELQTTTISFLKAARTAREASFERNGNASDKVAIDEYTRLIKVTEAQTPPVAVPLRDCYAEIPKP